MAGRRRSISDEEIALIRAMLKRGIGKTAIQAYFTHPDRPVNFGRITNIEEGKYGRGIVEATEEELDKFLENWRSARGAPIQIVAEAAVDFSKLSPVDPTRLLALFEQPLDKPPRLRDGETEELECKLSFHGPNNEKVLKAIAALANTRGGHILFGVQDDAAEIVGMKDERFTALDVNAFSMAFRSAMEPMPRFEIGHLRWKDRLVGAIYVYPEPDRPVIATKDVGTYRAGMIYYRYPGESRAIGGAEFRSILAERERKARIDAAETARRVIELGGNGAVLDLQTGKVEGRSAGFYLSSELLPKIQFIREGQFSENHGATTLRLVGDVHVVGEEKKEIVRERIVRQGITDADVLRNFLEQEAIEFPAEYIVHSCHTHKRYLPVFYYARQAKLSKQELIDVVAREETSLSGVKSILMDRIQGRVSARKPVTTASQRLVATISEDPVPPLKTSSEVIKLAQALQSFDDRSVSLDCVLLALKHLVSAARSLGWLDPGSEVRRAAAWIDEFYFRNEVAERQSEATI